MFICDFVVQERGLEFLVVKEGHRERWVHSEMTIANASVMHPNPVHNGHLFTMLQCAKEGGIFCYELGNSILQLEDFCQAHPTGRNLI